MALDQMSISPSDKKRIEEVKMAALSTYQEIDDRKESLKEMIKALAEEYNVKPAVFTKAWRALYKNKIADEKELADDVMEVLAITGDA